MRSNLLAFIFIIVWMNPFAAFAQPVPLTTFPAVENLPIRPELPDPFTMFDGTPVKTPEQWFRYRRPELKQLFQYYMYGFMPAPPGIQATVTKTDPTVFEGKATLKEVEIRINGLPENAPRIHLALFVPNHKTGPFPVFLGLNKCGNHTVVNHTGVTIYPETWTHSGCPKTDDTRGSETDFWCVENSINRGYAFATFHESDIDPDQPDFTDGIHPFYPDLPGPPETRWGTIAAWAWGLQRGVDYLCQDPDIDNTRVCLIGHSRRGKTALLAAAFDERVALVDPHQSGTGGCALSRNNDQETVKRINDVFPHWFNDMFTRFNDNEAKLPIDQHLLMALVSPRALIDTAGLQDKWANYDSALRALNEADKVYKFLGAEGMKGDGVIEEEEAIQPDTVGDLLQYRRDTEHTLNLGYWNQILNFADVYFAKRAQKPPLRVSEAYPTIGRIERLSGALDALIPADARIEVLAEGFDWSEGPVWVRDGNYLLFSDIPLNTVYKWKEGEGLSVYLKPSGYTGSAPRGGESGSNGLLLDPQGRLVLCQHGDRRLARMEAPLSDPRPEFTTLADRWDGKRFNSPNDAAYHKNGDLYFTDPPYGLEKNIDDPARELDFQGVYRLTPQGELSLVSREMSRPNGVAFSPDYKTLYVSNSDGRQPVWMAFPIAEDGTPGPGRVFFSGDKIKGNRRGGGDGLKVDSQGNLFATGPGGVLVISPEGEHLGTIMTGRPTSNCAFSGDGKTLYITADDLLLRISLTGRS